MKSSTGRWVSGDDFFDRERELRILENRVREGNHVLLTGQRRMGKTSILLVARAMNNRGASLALMGDASATIATSDALVRSFRIKRRTGATSGSRYGFVPQGHEPDQEWSRG